MCGGGYAPPLFLLPVFIVLEAVNGVSKGIKSMDEAIRANNLKMVELMKRKKHDLDSAASNQIQEKSTMSIQEIRTHSQSLSDEDREELAKLLIQRCAARLEQQSFSLAKEDLMEALSLMKSSNGEHARSFYLAEYLCGVCCYGNGEFKEAANYFKNSIDHREEIEAKVADNENVEKELQDLEEEFFSMQLEAKKPIEKVTAKWTRNWTQYTTNVSNFTNKAKNFYNHNLMLGTDKPILKTKPNTYITLELLYVRAGLSYYSGTYYTDAIPYFNRAIELGESYQSEYVESSYYNRGLCYYYLGELKQAISDFSKSISLMPLLKQRDTVYTMRAATYGRLGMINEKKHDETKAHLVNPFTKPVPLFHLRLLNDDLLVHIMSFLQTRQLLVFSSLDKYSRGLVQRYMQENTIELSRTELIAMERKNTSSLAKSLFLPKESRPLIKEMMKHTVSHSLLRENAKQIVIYQCADYYEYNGQNSFEAEIVSTFKNLKSLTILDLSNVGDILSANSPDLEFLEIGANSFTLNEYNRLFFNLTKLKHLKLGVAFFSENPFQNLPNLETVEYIPLCEDNINYYHTSQRDSPNFIPYPMCLNWDKLKEMNPHIIFKEYCGRTLYESYYNYY